MKSDSRSGQTVARIRSGGMDQDDDPIHLGQVK
jgi:hypothetical protein